MKGGLRLATAEIYLRPGLVHLISISSTGPNIRARHTDKIHYSTRPIKFHMFHFKSNVWQALLYCCPGWFFFGFFFGPLHSMETQVNFVVLNGISQLVCAPPS
jgi:hypothetical protein